MHSQSKACFNITNSILTIQWQRILNNTVANVNIIKLDEVKSTLSYDVIKLKIQYTMKIKRMCRLLHCSVKTTQYQRFLNSIVVKTDTINNDIVKPTLLCSAIMIKIKNMIKAERSCWLLHSSSHLSMHCSSIRTCHCIYQRFFKQQQCTSSHDIEFINY